MPEVRLCEYVQLIYKYEFIYLHVNLLFTFCYIHYFILLMEITNKLFKIKYILSYSKQKSSNNQISTSIIFKILLFPPSNSYNYANIIILTKYL